MRTPLGGAAKTGSEFIAKADKIKVIAVRPNVLENWRMPHSVRNIVSKYYESWSFSSD
jgi:hypothetical protein